MIFNYYCYYLIIFFKIKNLLNLQVKGLKKLISFKFVLIYKLLFINFHLADILIKFKIQISVIQNNLNLYLKPAPLIVIHTDNLFTLKN